jgi:hypothetical protein
MSIDPVSMELKAHFVGFKECATLQATSNNSFAAAEPKSLLLRLVSPHGEQGITALSVTWFGDIGMGTNVIALMANDS